ncbi:MAG: bifunctional phosphoribosyl-AMP cyclohydrolase/phosphoribosyl-ATP diphosphatase HisIE [Legionella sp.]
MSNVAVESLDWAKMEGIIPAIIQHAENGQVLMLGYMSQESLIATVTTGQLTLYSRSRQRLWRKGETSGNTMAVQHLSADCDNDSLLIQVIPKGPACHLGYKTCYQPSFHNRLGFIDTLIEIINERAQQQDADSYTVKLLHSGVNRCAQKVGEEGVETAIAAVSANMDELVNESADLLFHLLVLLKSCELSFYEVLHCLQERDLATHT